MSAATSLVARRPLAAAGYFRDCCSVAAAAAAAAVCDIAVTYTEPPAVDPMSSGGSDVLRLYPVLPDDIQRGHDCQVRPGGRPIVVPTWRLPRDTGDMDVITASGRLNNIALRYCQRRRK